MTGFQHDEPIDLSPVQAIVGRTGGDPSSLIPLLQALQDHYGYLPGPALEKACAATGLSPAAVHGAATFYTQFRLAPAGEHSVKVCIGTACHVKGAPRVYDAFRDALAIPEGADTDEQRLFTVEKVACLGCCMLAPAVQIDDITYGYVTPETVPRVLRDFLAGRGAAHEPLAPGRAEDARGEVRLCLCSSCAASGSETVHRELLAQARALDLAVRIRPTGCTGASYQAPLLEVRTREGGSFFYGRISAGAVRAILLRHFRPSGLVARLRAAASALLADLAGDSREAVVRYPLDVRDGPDGAYLTAQRRVVTEGAGEAGPLDLEAYRAGGGLEALAACGAELKPVDVVRRVREAGLRGRGGAGFPTGDKMEAVRVNKAGDKVVVCNGDEGDPGAFMDRMILESFPFRVLEGLAIAAFAVGATEAVIYVRAEYPLAVATVGKALETFRREAGQDVPAIRVVAGAGAFVCGEETALMAALEGRRGTPSWRPPYPAERGLHGRPTLVNNVETLACLPWIVRHGPGAFRALGTPSSPGTKAFALAGKIVRGGLVEVPMGLTLREIVDQVGGGLAPGRALKAVQVGGPSGGCVPASLADTAVDYEALASAGAIMGSGGLVVLDDTDCMVDVARYFLEFTRDESCGKCTFCRVGTGRMLALLEDLCEGRAEPGAVEALESLARQVRDGSLCGLGRTAPNPVLSALAHFRHEFDAHLEGRCPALRCRALIRYEITDACIGCTRCSQHCPAGAIPMNHYEQHVIDPALCVRCGTCRSVCPEDAVAVRTGGKEAACPD